MLEGLDDFVSVVVHRPFTVNSLLSPDIRHKSYLERVLNTQKQSSVHAHVLVCSNL